MLGLGRKEKHAPQQEENGKRNYTREIPVWIFGVAIGIGCLMIGAVNEQFADIYRKAIVICLECIGIG